MFGNGIYIRGIYAGANDRKPKKTDDGKLIADGYNMALTDGSGNFWRVKTIEDPASMCNFGDIVTVKLTNVNAYNNSVYYTGDIIPEEP